jgi:hypothetical protein
VLDRAHQPCRCEWPRPHTNTRAQEEREKTCQLSRAAYSKRVNEHTKTCSTLSGEAEIACYAKLGELTVWYSAVENTCKVLAGAYWRPLRVDPCACNSSPPRLARSSRW